MPNCNTAQHRIEIWYWLIAYWFRMLINTQFTSSLIVMVIHNSLKTSAIDWCIAKSAVGLKSRIFRILQKLHCLTLKYSFSYNFMLIVIIWASVFQQKMSVLPSDFDARHFFLFLTSFGKCFMRNLYQNDGALNIWNSIFSN